MPEKNVATPEELVAQAIKDNADSSKETSESLKSVAKSLEAIVEKSKLDAEKVSEESPAILELKSELALLKAQKAAESTSHVSGSADVIKSKALKFIKDFAAAVKEKKSFNPSGDNDIFSGCRTLEMKSLSTFNNSNAGAFVPDKRILGEININLQTINPVTSLVTNVNAGAIVAQELGYKTYDESYVDIFESNEGEGKTTSDLEKRGERIIHVIQESAKIKISDKTIHAAEAGELTTNPITSTLSALERRYEKKIARKILNNPVGMGVSGIFPRANITGSLIKKVATATQDVVTLRDVAALCINIKGEYVRNSAILIDRAVLNYIYFEAASDGHLKIEMFDYSNGIAALRTPERVIPLIGVDSSTDSAKAYMNDGFANYYSLDSTDASTYITTGFDKDATSRGNRGKALAILADWSRFYTLARSTVVQMGYDQSFGNLLLNGYVWGGKIGYVGGDVTTEEAGVVLYMK